MTRFAPCDDVEFACFLCGDRAEQTPDFGSATTVLLEDTADGTMWSGAACCDNEAHAAYALSVHAEAVADNNLSPYEQAS